MDQRAKDQSDDEGLEDDHQENFEMKTCIRFLIRDFTSCVQFFC